MFEWLKIKDFQEFLYEISKFGPLQYLMTEFSE